MWKDIKGYENIYQVNEKGEIKSLDRFIVKSNGVKEFKKGKFISSTHNKRSNYLECHLSMNGKRKCYKVHRLVAETFIPNPSNHPVVNHKDGNRLNNNVDNLEWCTYSENLKHSYNNLGRVKNSTKIKRRPCIVTDLYNYDVYRYKSIEETSRHIGISPTQIRRIINGECKNNKFKIEFEISH